MPLRRDHLSIGNVKPIRLLYFALATSTCVLAAEGRETFDQSTQLPQGWTVEDLCNWDRTCDGIAALAPLWEPGSRTGYRSGSS